MKFQLILAAIFVAGWFVEPSESLRILGGKRRWWGANRKPHARIEHFRKLATHEQAPDDTVNDLVDEHKAEIMKRSKIPDFTEEDWNDPEIPVEALGFFMVSNGGTDNYYIRVLIGGSEISHVKIYFTHGAWKGRTRDGARWGKRNGETTSKVAVVIGNKQETDKLSQAELDGSRK